MYEKIIEKIKCGRVDGFNLWREYYDQLNFEQHKDIADFWNNRPIFLRFAHVSFFMWAFKQLAKMGINLNENRVVELGSADGWLAYNCMSKIKFKQWKGYDLSSVMIEKTLPESKNLGLINIELNKQLWNTRIDDFEIFVSSHTIEHLSNAHFKELLDFLSSRANALILEVYVKGKRKEWTNYPGSHILTLDGNEIDKMIQEKGFVKTKGRYFGWLRHPLTGFSNFKNIGFKCIGTWRNHFTGVYIKKPILEETL